MRKKNEIVQKGLETKGCNTERRKALKNIAVGVGALAGISVLPERWSRPIIGQIAIPAHAQTSGEVGPVPQPQPQPQQCSASEGCYLVTAGGPAEAPYMYWTGDSGPNLINFYAQECSGQEAFVVPTVLAASLAEAESLLSSYIGSGNEIIPLMVDSAPDGCTFYVVAG